MATVGMTALVPSELIFACEKKPCDVNNFVPKSKLQPASKLCSWTAIWRDLILRKELSLDYLIVVAGGDCHCALVDGQKVALNGLDTFYLFYPFHEDPDFLKEQLDGLAHFLGGVQDTGAFRDVMRIKKMGLELDRKRVDEKVSASSAFQLLVSLSDLRGDLAQFEKSLNEVEEENVDCSKRVALLGVPPIYLDFHEVLESLGLHVVFDELLFEFARLSGGNIEDLAKNYCNYTFARNLEFRLDFLERELEKRKVDGVIHYTQFACHHLLEDEVMRDRLDYPFLTIQGDMPQRTPEQVKLRLEAFSEMMAGI